MNAFLDLTGIFLYYLVMTALLPLWSLLLACYLLFLLVKSTSELMHSYKSRKGLLAKTFINMRLWRKPAVTAGV